MRLTDMTGLLFVRFALDLLKLTGAPVARERRTDGGIQERNDLAVEIGDRVHIVYAVIVGIVHVLLRLSAGHESPAAIDIVIRFFAIHVFDLAAVNHDHVRGKASAVSLGERLDLVGRQRKTFLPGHRPPPSGRTCSPRPKRTLWLRRRQPPRANHSSSDSEPRISADRSSMI